MSLLDTGLSPGAFLTLISKCGFCLCLELGKGSTRLRVTDHFPALNLPRSVESSVQLRYLQCQMLTSTLIGLISVIMGIVLIIISLPYMATVIPFAAIFLYGLQSFYLRTSRQLRYMDLEAKSPLYTHLLETISGISSIRSFGWASSTLSTGLGILDVSQRPFYLLHCIQQWLQLVLDLFTFGLATLFVGIAVSTSSEGAGSIALGLLSMLTLTQSLVLLVTEWTELETSLGAIARLKDIETRVPSEAQAGETFIPESGWPRHGEISFNDVNAAYS